jgi:hypothetical protein
MSDVIVKNHIYDFMRSNNVSGAQQAINVIDRSEFSTIENDYNSNKPKWDGTYTTVRSNSASWSNNNTRVTLNTVLTSFNFTNDQSGVITTYTKTPNITAYVSSDINTSNYVTTIAQLSSGSVTIKLHPSYTTGILISYGELYETAGKGATANIVRVTDNTFLLTGLLQ